MAFELENGTSKPVQTEYRRQERQENDVLDRETREYIRSKLDPEEPALEHLEDVVQLARKKVNVSRQFLQKSAEDVHKNVYRLSTFLHAPRGWFLELCLRHELNVLLVPTFPVHDPCKELEEASRGSLFLQFCVDDIHVPAQLIVREMRVQYLYCEGFGDRGNVSVSNMANQNPKAPGIRNLPVLHEPSSLHTSSELVLPVEKATIRTLSPASGNDGNNQTQIAKTQTLVVKSCLLNKSMMDFTNQQNSGTTTSHSTSQFSYSVTNSGQSLGAQTFNPAPPSSQTTLEQVPYTNSLEGRILPRCQSMFSGREEGEDSLPSSSRCSMSNPELPDGLTSDPSQVESSVLSLRVDPLSFTPEVPGKNSSQNARTTTYCPQSELPHPKDSPGLKKNNGDNITTDIRLPFSRSREMTADNDQLQDRDRGLETSSNESTALRDVTIVRESKEALIPEFSENRVLIRGHYVNTVCGKVLPFTVFVHKTQGIQSGQLRPTLCGSYIRAMLTASKNLRWRFKHSVEQTSCP